MKIISKGEAGSSGYWYLIFSLLDNILLVIVPFDHEKILSEIDFSLARIVTRRGTSDISEKDIYYGYVTNVAVIVLKSVLLHIYSRKQI
jgi:hypothetical protein